MGEAGASETGWVVLVQLTALPAWLALARPRRAEVGEQVAELARDHPAVRLRWIDVEAFTGDCSDVLVAETGGLQAWNHLFEALRDSVLLTVPYFRVERILTGIEDGHRDYETASGSR